MKRKNASKRRLIGSERNHTLVGVQFDPYHRLVKHLLERFAELRWQVVDLNAFTLRLPAEVRFSGALVKCLPTDELAKNLLKQGVPTVRLGRLPNPDDPRLPAVILDQTAAGRLAAEHFVQRGFKHVGAAGADPLGDFRSFYESFQQRAEELGCQCYLLKLKEIELHAKVTSDRNFHDVQKQYMHDWWRTLPRPLGMLASNDMAAHRYCQWALLANLRVPEDIAVLGMGNSSLTCEGAVIPLSSIDTNESANLDAAIETLRRLIAGQTVAKTTIQIAPGSVVTRRSTDVLAASDPHVVKALRFMWDHIRDNLSVDQITKHVDVSRRTLEVGFQRNIGRGINAEYQRRRMEKGRDLLLQTDWSVSEIADYLGYIELKYFSKAFRDAHGISPMRYRKNTRQSS